MGHLWLAGAAEVVIHRGGSKTNDAVLLNASASEDVPALNRIVAAWSNSMDGDDRPWVIYAFGRRGVDLVQRYYQAAPGESAQRDAVAAWLDARLPLGSLRLAEMHPGDELKMTHEVEIEVDPPCRGSMLPNAVEYGLKNAGIECIYSKSDELLYDYVQYATGERSYEQIVDWADMYTAEHWEFLGRLDRLQLRLRDLRRWSPETLECFGKIVPAQQRDVDAVIAESQAVWGE